MEEEGPPVVRNAGDAVPARERHSRGEGERRDRTHLVEDALPPGGERGERCEAVREVKITRRQRGAVLCDEKLLNGDGLR